MSVRSLTCQLAVPRKVSGYSPECHPPVFLAPLTASIPQSLQQRSSFSSTATLSARKRHKRDGNPHRGESALRRTGLRYPVGMSKQPLPQPVLDPSKRSKIEVDPNHGLWGFFNKERKALTPPGGDLYRGRPWTVEELRHKSWEDLHSLWYICCKERNRIATESLERQRMHLDFPWDGRKRDMAVRATQAKIKHTLTERWYSWEEAWKVAKNDPEVNLNADPDSPAYQPKALEEEEEVEEAADEDEEVEEQPRAAARAA